MKTRISIIILALIILFSQLSPVKIFAQSALTRLEVPTGGLIIRNPVNEIGQTVSLLFLNNGNANDQNTVARINSKIVSSDPLKSNLELLVNNGTALGPGLKIDENLNTQIMGNLYASNGTNNAPAYSFSSQPNTGIGRILNGRDGSDAQIHNLGFVINGVPRAAFLNDGAFLVTDREADFRITGGTAPGSIISGHNRFFRSVNSDRNGTVRLIGVSQNNDVVIGGEPRNTQVIIGGGVTFGNNNPIRWRRAPDAAEDPLQGINLKGSDLYLAPDDRIDNIVLVGKTTLYENATSTTPKITFSENGDIETAGNIQTQGCTGCADLAEDYLSDQVLEAGEVVMVLADGSGKIQRSTSAYDPKIIGVVSSSPAIRISESGGVNISKGDSSKSKDGYPVALSGRVPVKVSAENGPIKPGDYLTSSSIPGVAMKAAKKGKVIGMAIEKYDSVGIGKIKVFMDVTWFSF